MPLRNGRVNQCFICSFGQLFGRLFGWTAGPDLLARPPNTPRCLSPASEAGSLAREPGDLATSPVVIVDGGLGVGTSGRTVHAKTPWGCPTRYAVKTYGLEPSVKGQKPEPSPLPGGLFRSPEAALNIHADAELDSERYARAGPNQDPNGVRGWRGCGSARRRSDSPSQRARRESPHLRSLSV